MTRVPRAEPSWSEYAAARKWPIAAELHPSRGHGSSEYLVEVRVAPEALSAYRDLVPGTGLPKGARVAAAHRERSGGQVASTFVMQKGEDGRWAYFSVGPTGRVDRGDTALCRRCHSQAPADSLFGPPRN